MFGKLSYTAHIILIPTFTPEIRYLSGYLFRGKASDIISKKRNYSYIRYNGLTGSYRRYKASKKTFWCKKYHAWPFLKEVTILSGLYPKNNNCNMGSHIYYSVLEIMVLLGNQFYVKVPN